MVIKRQADGSGRDGYIHFSNGGFIHKYKKPAFGNELRKYEIIERPPFDKYHADFDDYQRWYNKRDFKTRYDKGQVLKKLVTRLSPSRNQLA